MADASINDKPAWSHDSLRPSESIVCNNEKVTPGTTHHCSDRDTDPAFIRHIFIRLIRRQYSKGKRIALQIVIWTQTELSLSNAHEYSHCSVEYVMSDASDNSSRCGSILARTSSPYDGWESYPSNIPGFDTLCDDGDGYNDRLKLLSSSLFSNKVDLHVIDANGWCTWFGTMSVSIDSMIVADVRVLIAAIHGFVAESIALKNTPDAEAYFQSPEPDLRLM